MQESININKLTYLHDTRKTDGISDLSLTIPKKQITALIGPSGSGKSTTLKCISGILTPQKGEMTNLSDENIKYLDQSTNFNDKSICVFDYLCNSVEHKIPYLDQRENHIRTLLAKLSLSNEIHSPLNVLSAGQAQRVHLAETLAQNPSVLLLDEPFANLDPELTELIYEDLFEILEDMEITIIMATHSIEEALGRADNIVILNFGQLQAFGKPIDLYFSPPNLFTANYLCGPNVLSSKINKKEMNTEIFNHKIPVPEHLKEADYVMLSIPREAFEIDHEGENIEIISKKFLGPLSELTILFKKQQLNILLPSHKVRENQRLRISLNYKLIHIIGRL